MNKTRKTKKDNRQKYLKISKAILAVVALAGIITIAMVTPNALQMLKIFNNEGRRKSDYRYYVKTALSRLFKRKLVKFERKGEKTFVRLTEKGKMEFLRYRLGELSINKPKKWDEKWRIIIFDIKEFKRNLRDALRKELINLEFLRLQDSVWVYPYECEEIAILLKSSLRLEREVLYMTVEKIENDKWLKKEFNLS